MINNPIQPISDLMDLKDLCLYLGKSKSSIYRLMAKGKLPARRINGRWNFIKAEVDRWKASLPGVNLPAAG